MTCRPTPAPVSTMITSASSSSLHLLQQIPLLLRAQVGYPRHSRRARDQPEPRARRRRYPRASASPSCTGSGVTTCSSRATGISPQSTSALAVPRSASNRTTRAALRQRNRQIHRDIGLAHAALARRDRDQSCAMRTHRLRRGPPRSAPKPRTQAGRTPANGSNSGSSIDAPARHRPASRGYSPAARRRVA